MNVLQEWHACCCPAVPAVMATLPLFLLGYSAELILSHSQGPIGHLNAPLFDLNVWWGLGKEERWWWWWGMRRKWSDGAGGRMRPKQGRLWGAGGTRGGIKLQGMFLKHVKCSCGLVYFSRLTVVAAFFFFVWEGGASFVTSHLAYLHQCFQMFHLHESMRTTTAEEQTKVKHSGGGLGALGTPCGSVNGFKRILWCPRCWGSGRWLMVLLSSGVFGSPKWINNINITVDRTFVSSMIILLYSPSL